MPQLTIMHIGRYRWKDLIILIDSGITYIFIYKNMIKKIKIVIVKTIVLAATIINGNIINIILIVLIQMVHGKVRGTSQFEVIKA